MSNTKKVLILCTGNSCRSIIAEALINVLLEVGHFHTILSNNKE